MPGGGRVVAVGTTTVRALESQAHFGNDCRDTNIFIADWVDNVEEQKLVIAHELVHALQDQHFGLDAWLKASLRKHHDDNHAALKAAYEQLVKEGVKGLSYVPGDHLYGDDSDGATDGSHASDLGFHRQADIFEPFLKAALGR